MSETVYRIRYATPGFDDNGDPTPGGQTRTPLQARAIAPGASRRNVTVGRNGESIEHTVSSTVTVHIAQSVAPGEVPTES